MKSKRKNPQIVTIGGGTGAPTIIRSLVSTGYSNIVAVTTATDSGGRSGMVRTDERDRVISIGDWANCLFALIDSQTGKKNNLQAFLELASFTDGRKRNLGYSIFYGLLEMYQNDFIKAQKHLARMLDIDFCGISLPVSTQPTNLFFETKNGNVYKGEHELDIYQMSKDTVIGEWFEPEISVLADVSAAIIDADYIIYCPGSLYGSLLANFLPKGMKKALSKTKAVKIFVPNLVSDRNQTHDYDLEKYFEILGKYTLLEKPFDVAILPYLSRKLFEETYPEISQRYADESSHVLDLKPDSDWSEKHMELKIIEEDIMVITPHLRLRHDPMKLSKLWQNILK